MAMYNTINTTIVVAIDEYAMLKNIFKLLF
jgi:hypothetical protein